MSSRDWNQEVGADYVSIGTHKLFLRAAGPPGPPSVIVVAGLADSSVPWAAVSREVSKFARIYTYDRSGLGKSEAVPDSHPQADEPRNARLMAEELSTLLNTARIAPPYVIVMHSYGSIIGREFIDLRQKDVAGALFVEANTENSYKVRPENLILMLSAIIEGIDEHEVTSTTIRHKLTKEEWAAFKAKETQEEKDRHGRAATEEFLQVEESSDILAGRKQLDKQALGNKPVVVIKGEELEDVALILAESKKRGTGLPEYHEEIERWLKMGQDETDLQREHLRLSSNARYINAKESGHDVHLTQPDIIADQVKWILEQIKG